MSIISDEEEIALDPVMHVTSEVSPLPKVSILEESYDEPLTKQLFGSELEGVVTPAWNELVTQNGVVLRAMVFPQNSVNPCSKNILFRRM